MFFFLFFGNFVCFIIPYYIHVDYDSLNNNVV